MGKGEAGGLSLYEQVTVLIKVVHLEAVSFRGFLLIFRLVFAHFFPENLFRDNFVSLLVFFLISKLAAKRSVPKETTLSWG